MKTETPKVYSISYAEIEDFVRKQPKDDSYVGMCSDPQRCLVALAIKAKYKPHAVLVNAGGYAQITFQGRSKEPVWHDVEITGDWVPLVALIHSFDALGKGDTPVTKADVLPLFEEAA
jgi:hypothetical protein